MIGLISCIDCGPFNDQWRVYDLRWHNAKAVYSDTSYPRLTTYTIENDSVLYSNYAIVIVPNLGTYASLKSTPKWNFSFINSAYACSPPDPKSEETIDSIVILSLNNYDSNHPAGKNLADLFEVVVNKYENNTYYTKYNLVDYNNLKQQIPDQLTLMLKTPPDSTSNFEFLVKYYQQGVEDNDYFEFTTNRIQINRN